MVYWVLRATKLCSFSLVRFRVSAFFQLCSGGRVGDTFFSVVLRGGCLYKGEFRCKQWVRHFEGMWPLK